MIVTKEDLENFTGKFTDENNSLVEMYLNAAVEMVEKFLGYSLERKDYSVRAKSTGYKSIPLPAPIIDIESVMLGGQNLLEFYRFEAKRNFFTLLDDNEREVLFERDTAFTVNFSGGFEDVPDAVRLCVLQLASLFWETSGGNLAVSSTSFADSNTRVFTNFKADRFLNQIAEWKIYG